MSHVLRFGVADQIAYFRAYNTDGSAKTDLTSSTTGLALSVFRIGASSVSIASLSNKAADDTAHADGAIRNVGGNLYTVDIPDAATATQVPSIVVRGSYTGGVIEGLEHPITGYDPSVNYGTNAQSLDIQSRIPTTLDSGNMRSSVQSMNSNTITASVIATGAITASAIQTNAITDDKLASSAITEIQSGLATSAGVTAGFSEIKGAGWSSATDTLEEIADASGGGGTVTIAPLSSLAPERVNGTTISVAVGDVSPVSIDVYDSNGVAIDLTAQGNLEVCIESRSNIDLQVVAHASITISGTGNRKATWTPNAAAVGTVDKQRWSLRTASGKRVLAYGPWVVERVALNDA
jgi:hypothetical protein